MNKQGAIVLLLIGLLVGGALLLNRKPAASSVQCCGEEAISVIPIKELPHYRNKETRRIEYNGDGLPTLIEITRDYTIA
jgi:hypothetical protein